MKAIIVKTTKDAILFKKYKCIDGWTRNKDECWRFSIAGAKKSFEF